MCSSKIQHCLLLGYLDTFPIGLRANLLQDTPAAPLHKPHCHAGNYDYQVTTNYCPCYDSFGSLKNPSSQEWIAEMGVAAPEQHCRLEGCHLLRWSLPA